MGGGVWSALSALGAFDLMSLMDYSQSFIVLSCKGKKNSSCASGKKRCVIRFEIVQADLFKQSSSGVRMQAVPLLCEDCAFH